MIELADGNQHLMAGRASFAFPGFYGGQGNLQLFGLGRLRIAPILSDFLQTLSDHANPFMFIDIIMAIISKKLKNIIKVQNTSVSTEKGIRILYLFGEDGDFGGTKKKRCAQIQRRIALISF